MSLAPAALGPDVLHSGTVTLRRKSKRPLRFVGTRLCHTTGVEQDAVSLWARQDGRLAVSLCVAGREDAVVARTLDEAGLWLERQCMWGGRSDPPHSALDLLIFLETCLADRQWHDRLAHLAQGALAKWPDSLKQSGGVI